MVCRNEFFGEKQLIRVTGFDELYNFLEIDDDILYIKKKLYLSDYYQMQLLPSSTLPNFRPWGLHVK